MFQPCVTAINVNGLGCVLTGNTILEYGITAAGPENAWLAKGIDLSGTSSVKMLCGQPAGRDLRRNALHGGRLRRPWAGNYNVLSGGVTAVNPV